MKIFSRELNTQQKAPPVPSRKDYTNAVFYSLALVLLTLLCIYVIFRGVSLFNPGYRWIDHLFAFLLIGAEIFTIFHAIGYLATVVRSLRNYRVTKTRVFVPFIEPPIGVVVASFNEDVAMLEDTIVSVTNLEYANKKIYILDDSTNENLQKGARALAEKYGCNYVHRINRRGYKAGAINDLLKVVKDKYLAIFDADQKPVYNFLKETIPLLEEDEKLAFVQTPQFYANSACSPVAKGAYFQQVIFYEYICEGKSTSNAMFCCGSNVALRTESLRDVGGFDETSVTEDFATGLRLHMRGWKSLYYNKVFIYGLGPETLAGYFTQQMRWAMGTMGVFKKLITAFLRNPGALSSGQWWEYLLSSSYYFIGWANLIFMVSPVAYILFGIRPLVAEPIFYFAAFVPYFFSSLFVFYRSMGIRGYKASDLTRGQTIGFICFWVLIVSSVVAMSGKKRPFAVTPKGIQGKLPIRYLTPQLMMLTLSLIAVAVGLYRVVATTDFVMLINIFWVAYHSFLLGSVFYFNRSFRGYPDRHIFRDWAESKVVSAASSPLAK